MRRVLFYLLTFLMLLSPAAYSDDSRAIINVFGYGYNITVTINNIKINCLTGGSSQMAQVYNVNHPLKEKAQEEFKSNFCLKKGINTIEIEFESTNPSEENKLELNLNIPEKVDPLVNITTKEVSGKIIREFEI